MAGTVIFNTINANGMERNAAVLVGENSATGWDSHNKNQNAVGFIFSGFGALNALPWNVYIVSDNDLLDTTILDGLEVKASPTGQV